MIAEENSLKRLLDRRKIPILWEIAMKKLKDFEFHNIKTRHIQWFCLVLVGLLELFTMVFGATVDGPMRGYVVFYETLAGILFFGASIRETMSRKGRNLLLLGLGFCLWTLLLQLSDYRHYSPTAYYGARFIFSAFFCEYLMLLPCAAILDEGEKAVGLKILGGFYAAAIVAYLGLTVLLYLDRIPTVFSRFCGWINVRLGINWHPNIMGQALSITIGFGLALVCGAKKLRSRIALGALTAVACWLLALTNARATTLFTCCIFGGIAFYFVWSPGTDRATALRFFLGLLAAAAVIGALFSLSGWAAKANSRYLTRVETQELEVNTDYADGRIRDLSEDFWSFNGRTEIWADAAQGLRDHPEVLISGVKDPGKFISQYYEDGVAHAHNSWLQTLLRLGIVGLGFALVLTVLAIRDCIQLMFLKKSTLMQKVICMQVICLLGSEFFEPYLFYAEAPYNFINAAFLVCLGYLEYWNYRAEPISGKERNA